MNKLVTDRLIVSVAACGLAIASLSLAAWGGRAALSAGCGVALALFDLVVLRIFVSRLLSGEVHNRVPVAGLMFVKLGALLLVVYLVITRGLVQPVAFMFGLSSLVVGTITGSLFARSGQRSES